MTAQVKYKLGEREANGLCRVIAVVAFADVSVGDVGGYVEDERNLAHAGDAWVYGDAQVSENAQVAGDARVSGNARVSGYAWVSENARVSGNAQVYWDARVYENAWVSGNARVYGDARVSVVCLATPKVITGLLYTLTITDEHLLAGCQVHTFHEWRTKTEREVLAMGGKAALVFYKETLTPLMDALKLGV